MIIDYESNSFANKIHRLTYRFRERYSDKKEGNYLKLITGQKIEKHDLDNGRKHVPIAVGLLSFL